MYKGPGFYRHYKGGEYEVLGLALQENTVTKKSPEGRVEQVGEGHGEVTFVIYRPVTAGSLLESRAESFWAREVNDFNEVVRVDGKPVPRFEPIGQPSGDPEDVADPHDG